MKSLINKKFTGLMALLVTFVLPVVAFAADEEPVPELISASGDGSGWIIMGIMIVIFFVLFVSLLAVGSGLSAAMIGYKLGKEDE